MIMSKKPDMHFYRGARDARLASKVHENAIKRNIFFNGHATSLVV